MVNFQEPRPNKTRPMVEAGILAALMLILVLLRAMVPVVGNLATLLFPCCLCVIALRSGVRFAVMTVFVTVMLGIVMVGPLMIGVIALLDLAPALVFMGMMVYRKPIGHIFFWPTLTQVVVQVCFMWILVGFFADISFTPEAIAGQMQQLLENDYIRSTFSSEELEEVHRNIPLALPYIYGTAAAVMFLFFLAGTFVNYKLVSYFTRRFNQTEMPALPPYVLWDFPRWLGMPLVIVFICNAYVQYRGLVVPIWMVNLGMFFLFTSGFFMLFQGFAVMKFLLARHGVPRYVFYVLLVLSSFLSFIGTMAVFIGVIDIFLDYRRIRKKPQEG